MLFYYCHKQCYREKAAITQTDYCNKTVQEGHLYIDPVRNLPFLYHIIPHYVISNGVDYLLFFNHEFH